MHELESLFSKYLETAPVFSNRDVLTISFTPETIPHREMQITALGRMLAPALKGARPSNIFIYGRTGTGKTCVSRYVTEQLKKAAEKANVKIRVLYINCKMKRVADTEYRVLSQIINEFGVEVPFTGLPTDQLYQRFFDIIDKEDQVIILIIDEIDVLVQRTGDEILYNITRINQELKKAKLSIIGITNDLNFIERLDPRVKSSLSEEEMIFPPYNAVELQDILRQRVCLAFLKDSIEEGVIEKCAALAAQEHGDARRALDLLRVAAELAEREASQKVQLKHVDMAQEKIDMDRIFEIVKSQPKQSQAVLWAICQLARQNPQKALAGEIKDVYTGDVFSLYEKICRGQRLKPLTHRRISDLIAELDMFGIITTSVVSKGRYGRTRTISLNIPEQVLIKLEGFLADIFR